MSCENILKNQFLTNLLEQREPYNIMIYHFDQNDEYLYLIYNSNERLCTYFL